MLRIALIVLVGLWAGAANAADKLVFGPPPAWVKVAGEPKPGTLPPTGLAVSFLRYDEQLRFEPQGQSAYIDRVSQARTAVGLSGMGTIAFSWDPARETVTVHRVRLIRDGVSIDLLAKQTFTIIRREENLQQIVDGRLTASLQPEDLRVGDVLEVAYTTTFFDPVMQGHADFASGLGALRGLDTLSIRASWPSTQDVAWRLGSGLPKPKESRRGGQTELTLEVADLPELKGPKGAPARYWPSRDIEFSGFKSWAEVASTVAPRFEKAATLAPNSPLKAEAAKILAASTDPKVRAAAALKLVQEQVRYLGLLLSDGGYTPVDADKTWQRRFGECKAKAVLLVALLHELNINAEPALVNAYGDAQMDRHLPRMSAFNHAIVRAEIDGKVYWLDGTRPGDESLDLLETPTHGWALPVRAAGAELIELIRAPRSQPDGEIALTIDATAGIEAAGPAKGEMILRGEASMYPTLMSSNLPVSDRDKMLKTLWSAYPGIEVKSTTFTHDAKTGETRIGMEGTAKLRWFPSNTGATFFPPNAGLGWRADFKRDPGPGDDAPFAVSGYPSASVYHLTVKLPLAGEGFVATAPDVDKTLAGRTFFRKTRLEAGVLTLETRNAAVAPEFSASEAKAAGEALSEMANTRVYLTAPAGYRATPGDIAAWQAEEPKTAQDYVVRGVKFGRVGRPTEARADFDKALGLDPKSSSALSGRGLVRAMQNDLKGARADFEQAIALEDRNGQAHVGLAEVNMHEGRVDVALTEFTRATYLQPGNMATLLERAEAYRQAGELDRALADTDEVLRADPKNPRVRYERLQIFVGRHEEAKGLAEADLLVAAAPNDPQPLIYRGALLTKMDRRADADRDFAASIAVKPTITAYLTRAGNRPKTELAARLADIDAAEKLEPKALDIPLARARVLADAGRYPDAIQALDKATKANIGSEQAILSSRAWTYAKAGQAALATKDFAALRAKADGSVSRLNSLCWNQATVGFALDAALGDCLAALKLDPKAAHVLDSKGFVLLRLGRFQESVEAYDAALEVRPRIAESLYGRGLAKLRLGKTADGEADLAAAHVLGPKVDQVFADYGVTR